jgi:hypothetical protein
MKYRRADHSDIHDNQLATTKGMAKGTEQLKVTSHPVTKQLSSSNTQQTARWINDKKPQRGCRNQKLTRRTSSAMLAETQPP